MKWLLFLCSLRVHFTHCFFKTNSFQPTPKLCYITSHYSAAAAHRTINSLCKIAHFLKTFSKTQRSCHRTRKPLYLLIRRKGLGLFFWKNAQEFKQTRTYRLWRLSPKKTSRSQNAFLEDLICRHKKTSQFARLLICGI